MVVRGAVLAVASYLLASHALCEITGSVQDDSGKPIASTYVALFNEKFDQVLGQDVSGADGSFTLDVASPPEVGHLVVQPPAGNPVDGIEGYAQSPRVIRYSGETEAAITLPQSATLVLRGYDAEGKIIRWQAMRDRGMHGDQFVYATDLQMSMAPAVVWPAYDEEARQGGSDRNQGLPALVVAPGNAVAAHVLYWETQGYGKLWLRADNAGKGFAPQAGETVIIDLNVELARTAVADLFRRAETFPPDRRMDIAALGAAMDTIRAMEDPVAKAAKADALLVSALRLRDELELALAKSRFNVLRNGTVTITAEAGKEIALTLKARAFHFGVFQGGQFSASVFQAARDAGFDMSTLLLGWGWLDMADNAGIDKTYGLSRQRDMGFTLKAHGVTWLQGYGILPKFAYDMPHDTLRTAMIEFQQRLLASFVEDIAIWEAMNEPPATNVVNMKREEVTQLIAVAAESIKFAPQLTSLVNAAHEIDFGQKYSEFKMDGSPLNEFPLSYPACLDQAEKDGALDHVDVIALQYYPGFHFGDRFFGLQGPCVPPSWIVDAAERYAAYGKPIHISEFSLPDGSAPAKNGYWREPWSRDTQAAYAETAFNLVYGNPHIESISWWDITDRESSVVGGGLMTTDGSPKPVMKALAEFMDSVSPKTITGTTDAEGHLSLNCAAGDYTLPDGQVITVKPGETVSIAIGSAP